MITILEQIFPLVHQRYDSKTQTDDGFAIIDQHALHERIMYEDLCRRIRGGKLESQKLLIPESFELSPIQAEVLEDNVELIEKLGIEIAPFGPRIMFLDLPLI